MIIDFANSRIVDHSGIEAINSLAARYLKVGDRVEVNILEDPDYHVAMDRADDKVRPPEVTT